MRASAASAASRSPSVPAPANSASTFRSFSRSRASPAIAAHSPIEAARSEHHRARPSIGGSALAVADEGADDAILAAVLIALAERRVLRRREPRRGRKSKGATGVTRIDRERRAIAPHRRDHLAVALALAQRRGPRRLLFAEVVGKAISAAGADRERAGGLRRRERRKRDARRHQHGRQHQSET